MRRVNTFEVRPLTESDRLLLLEVLGASAALWNELTYVRRQAFFAGDDIWDVDADRYRNMYQGTLGCATAQQVIRRNNGAWRSFFALCEAENENPSPPGYWKESGDRRELRTLVRNDQYTLQWGDRSRLEIPIGFDLKEKYGFGYHERLRLEARGDPRWDGQKGRLELVYDNSTESFRARQPVKDVIPRRDETLATTTGDEDVVAALDIGANNLVACTTSRDDQRLYHGRPAFNRFRQTTERIADLQSRLEPRVSSSRQIRRLYQQRKERRDHLQDGLVRDLARWLFDCGTNKVIVGDLDDVLSPHWNALVNEKTHLFWAHGRFRRRLHEVVEGEYGIEVREETEAGSSSRCPRCGSQDTNRHGDAFHCPGCGFDGHSDLAASENLLYEHTNERIGSMARPAAPDQNRSGEGHRSVPCFEWDDHRWRRRDRSTKEESANRSTRYESGKLASGETGS